MYTKLLLAALIATAGAGCSTAYKNTQTPDDVYYSPMRESVGEREIQKEETRYETTRRNSDRSITMSIYDRRWRYFGDDYNAYYDPYRYGYSCGYYYNPYYYPSPVYISGAAFINPLNTKPRMSNLGSYNYANMVVVDPKSGTTQTVRNTRRYNSGNSDPFIRRVITPEASGSPGRVRSADYDNRTRSYNPSSTPSGSGGSRSSGSPVSRPVRRG